MEVTNKVGFNEEEVTSTSVSEVSSDTVLPKLASVQGRTSGPTRRSTKGGWTEQEDDMLSKTVKLFNGKNWKKIAECFPGRSDVQCLHRWQKVLNPDLVKGPWTKEEDDRIIELVKKYGSKKWSVIAQSLPGRIGKQCRERWHNHLNPEIKKHAWTREEELTLIRAHQIYGNKWAELAKFLPGRADNSIKNHWNCSVKKRLDSYLASEFTGDLLCINAYDSYKYDRNEGSLKRKGAECDPEAVCSLVQEDSDSDIDTSLGVSLLGVSNGRQRNSLYSEAIQIENRCLKEERHSMKECVNCIRSDCGSPVTCDLSSESSITHLSTHEPGDLSNISSRPSAELSLSLSISSDPVDVMPPKTNSQSPCLGVPVTSKGNIESPKRPRHNASPLRETCFVNSKLNIECNTHFPYLSSGEVGGEKGHTCRKSKVSTSPQSENVSFGPLFYETHEQTNPNIFIRDGRYSSTEKNIQLESCPSCCSTPPSHVGSISVSSSPEAILRTAAKNFKNTPSIIRKRTRQTSERDCNRIDVNSICISEVRNGGSSNDSQGSSHSCDHVLAGLDDPTTAHLLKVKWLSLSSPGLHAETDVPSKSLEKRLEYAFDLEWDTSKSKGSVPADSSGVMSNQNFVRRGIGINCNSVI